MKIFALIISVFWLTATGHAQDVIDVGSRRPAPDLPEWSALLPEIKYCVKSRAASSDDGVGHARRILEFENEYPDLGSPASFERQCATFWLDFSYPFSLPPAPTLTKQQLREKNKQDKKRRKQEEKARKLIAVSAGFFPKPPPSRPFSFKGYLAIQHFNAGCDYITCPNPTLVEIQFAPGRVLHVSVERNFSDVEAILGGIDFDALNAEISNWITAKLAADKTKGPPVSEKP